jgi:DNA uptake protein ComE-like DNA-binding protein
VFFTEDDRDQLCRIEQMLGRLHAQGGCIVTLLEALQASEKAAASEIERAVNILQATSAALQAALAGGLDPAAVQAIISDLDAHTAALKAQDDASAPPTPPAPAP